MNKLKNKVVVITGSTRGFGFAIAESMLEAGATSGIKLRPHIVPMSFGKNLMAFC